MAWAPKAVPQLQEVHPDKKDAVAIRPRKTPEANEARESEEVNS
jgi:hypothetical protein